MIVWIASYPKSGNTWIRSFLCSYFFLDLDKESFSFDVLKHMPVFPNKKLFNAFGSNPKNLQELAKSWIQVQKKINLNKKVNFLKTHNAFGNYKKHHFTDKINTLGAIYIVRDPRDVLVSYSKHMKKSISETLKLIQDDNHIGFLEDKEGVIGDIRGSWSQHYNSWKNFNIREKLIIKYEDLIEDPFNNFLKAINYLNRLIGLKVDEENIKKCIKITSFNNLQNLEKTTGFKEKLTNHSDVPFFNTGKVNQWQKVLDKETINIVEKKFAKEMSELNYI
jgi:hypothetical protein